MADPFSKFAPKNIPEWLKDSNKKIQEYNQQIKEAQSAKPAMTGKPTDSTSLSGRGPGEAEPNVLNKFASYITIFTLSALSREELEDNTIMLGQPAHDVIAKSAGIGNDGNFSPFNDEDVRTSVGKDKDITIKRTEQQKAMLRNSSNILSRGHDLFFERVMIKGSNSANSARKLMQYNEIEMDLHEPFGVTLFEKLRAAANNNKFRDHTDAPFLLTIEFRGFDDLGQPIGGKSITKRFLPIRITNAEMEINAGGTMYHIKASPWTEFAMFDRFLYTRSSGTLLEKLGPNRTKPASTLTAALKLLEERLNQQQKDEINQGVRNVADTYVIRTTITAKEANLADESKNWEIDSAEGSFRVTIAPNQSIAEIITNLVKRCDAFRDIVKIAKDYWNRRDTAEKDLKGQVTDEEYYKYVGSEMVDWFKIKTTVYTSPTFDHVRKTEAKTIVYEVIPHKIHILNFTVPGLSGSKLWGKFTKKKYKYIYTGENTEILDLKINYKVGFFLSGLVDGSGAQGIFKDMQTELSRSKTTGRIQRFTSYSKDFPELGLPIKMEPSIYKSVDGNTGAGASQIAVDQFYDYLTNSATSDMVRVEMTIMGDPAFIGQEHFLPIKQKRDQNDQGGEEDTQIASPGRGLLFDEQLGTFNFDQAECLVTLDFRFPTDLDERKGVMNFANQENIMFSGLYKVPQIESLWDKGKFTQTLTMVRMNNQGEEIGTVSETQIRDAIDAAKNKVETKDLPNLDTFEGVGPINNN